MVRVRRSLPVAIRAIRTKPAGQAAGPDIKGLVGAGRSPESARVGRGQGWLWARATRRGAKHGRERGRGNGLPECPALALLARLARAPCLGHGRHIRAARLAARVCCRNLAVQHHRTGRHAGNGNACPRRKWQGKSEKQHDGVTGQRRHENGEQRTFSDCSRGFRTKVPNSNSPSPIRSARTYLGCLKPHLARACTVAAWHTPHIRIEHSRSDKPQAARSSSRYGPYPPPTAHCMSAKTRETRFYIIVY